MQCSLDDSNAVNRMTILLATQFRCSNIAILYWCREPKLEKHWFHESLRRGGILEWMNACSPYSGCTKSQSAYPTRYRVFIVSRGLRGQSARFRSGFALVELTGSWVRTETTEMRGQDKRDKQINSSSARSGCNTGFSSWAKRISPAAVLLSKRNCCVQFKKWNS